MPKLRVKTPSDDVISQQRRAYAILKLTGGEDGSVDEQALANYGEGDKISALASKGDEVAFDTFAKAVFKEPTVAEIPGEGDCIGWAAAECSAPLKPWRFPRRAPAGDDIVLQITYCGMCHSDIHQVRNEWHNSSFPMVPGHEILGVVVATGPDTKGFAVGDFGAIGCMVDSCMECKFCKRGDEQYCGGPIGCSVTYNGKMQDGETPTYGGYSSHIVCREAFVISIPAAMHEPSTAPLLCAGITTYAPMRDFGCDKPGMRVGVVGLGGLGHMAVKFSKAFKQHVTVISRSEAKRQMALEELGADAYVAMSDPDAVTAAAMSFDAIINTVSAEHNIDGLMGLLDVDGQMLLVGAPEEPHKIGAWSVLLKRRSVRGTMIGGIAQTRECLEFCSEHGIRCDVEVIRMEYVNEAIERMMAGDVKFRFVIDNMRSVVA